MHALPLAPLPLPRDRWGPLTELVAAPALLRGWWTRLGQAGRHRWRATLAGSAAVAVVVVCTAAWWDPAITAVFDAIGEWISTAATEAMSEAATQFMSLAFNNPLTEISDAEWSVATRQASRWGAVFAVVAVAACAVEVVAALIARDTSRVLRAGVVAALAWPMTVAAILLLAELVAVTDGLSGQMFDNVAGTGAVGSTAAATAMGAAVGGLTAITVGGGWIVIVIGALVCVVGLVMIAMVMAARAFGLLVATGFAPVALMLVGFRGTRAMARKWVEVVIGLLLTKPLAAGIIVLCLELAGEGSLDSFVMGTVGLWVAVFSPALALSLVSFAGAHLSAAVTSHAAALKGLGAQATQAGATRLALEGPNTEALGKLGAQAAGLAKSAAGWLGDLGAKLAGTGKPTDTETGEGDPTPTASDNPDATPTDGPEHDGGTDTSPAPDPSDAAPEGTDTPGSTDAPEAPATTDVPDGGDVPEGAGGDQESPGGDAPLGSEVPEGSGVPDGGDVPEGSEVPGTSTDGASGDGSAGGEASAAPGPVEAGGVPGAVVPGAQAPDGQGQAAPGSGAPGSDGASGSGARPAATGDGPSTPSAPARTGGAGEGGSSGEGGPRPSTGGAPAPAGPGSAPAPRGPGTGGTGGGGPNPFGGR
ncbi:MAG: hypothetical protein IE923_03555 [Micrococcales bacterium]|nr:hypothetical protein [Micrococcales bacterium]